MSRVRTRIQNTETAVELNEVEVRVALIAKAKAQQPGERWPENDRDIKLEWVSKHGAGLSWESAT